MNKQFLKLMTVKMFLNTCHLYFHYQAQYSNKRLQLQVSGPLLQVVSIFSIR